LTDIGGNFSTKKVWNLFSNGPTSSRGSGFGWYYTGPEHACDPFSLMNDALNAVAFSSESTLAQKGTKAVAQSLPTNPVVGGATFLGELKAGLPKLIGKELFKTGGKDLRKYGSEYLNVEFGWKPMVSDLMKFGKSVIESDKTIQQLHRDSGKNIHRKFTFPDEVTTSEYQLAHKVSWTPAGSLYAYCYKNPGGINATVNVNTVTRTWFSGCFTYHMDLGSSDTAKISQFAAKMRKLYGLEITPEVVWQLAPWSWAVDWEGSIGDGLHNISRFANDGLVMRYGYIMQEKSCDITYTLPGGGRLDDSPNADLIMRASAVSKIRRRATPFGFGFDMNALTGRQSAILGALGISRGPRHL